eukprot:COSAG04_NODE_644_length_11643_cov_11.736983_3_plen_191_part_00
MSAAAGSRPNERPSEELRAARNEIERLRSELHQLREDEAAPLLDAATRGPQQQAAAERRGGGSGRALGALLAVLAVLGALLFASGALSLGPGRSGPPPPAQPPHDAQVQPPPPSQTLTTPCLTAILWQGRLVFLRSFVDQQVGVLGLLSYLDKPIPKPLSPRRSLLTVRPPNRPSGPSLLPRSDSLVLHR